MLKSFWAFYIRTWKFHAPTQLFSIFTLILSFSLVLMIFICFKNVNIVFSSWGERPQVSVYLKEKTPTQTVNDLEDKLSEIQGVEKVHYISEKEAFFEFKQQLTEIAPDVVKDGDFENPFPSSFLLTFKEPIGSAEDYDRFAAKAQSLVELPSVSEVAFGQSWLKDFSMATDSLKSAVLVTLMTLVLGVAFIVSNGIRASISHRREEIEILELVGATAKEIRRPFILEGAFTTFLTSLLALGVSLLIFYSLISFLSQQPALFRIARLLQFPSVFEIFVFVASCGLGGALAAFLIIKKINGGWAAREGLAKLNIWLVILGASLALSPKLWANAPQRAITTKIEEGQARLIHYETAKRQALKALYSANKNIKKISEEKSRLSEKKMAVEARIHKVALKIIQLEDVMGPQKKEVRHSLHGLYQLSGKNYFSFLLLSQSPAQLDRQQKFLKIFVSQKMQKLQVYRKTRNSYNSEKQDLNLQISELVRTEKGIEEKAVSLRNDQANTLKIVRELDTFRKRQMDEIRELRERSLQSELNAQEIDFNVTFKDYLLPSFFEEQGKLIAPVSGSLKQKFGLTRDSELQTESAHKGWFFATPAQQPVRAVFDGKVVFSGTIDGYGPTVIIEHGQNYYSVYSYLKESNVKDADKVGRQQMIGWSGGESEKFGSGLYFEIRHFSEPEDPAQWLLASAQNKEKI